MLCNNMTLESRNLSYIETMMSKAERKIARTWVIMSLNFCIRGHSTITWTEFCHFNPPSRSEQFLYPEHGQKQTFFDPLSPSSCPRSYCMPHKYCFEFKKFKLLQKPKLNRNSSIIPIIYKEQQKYYLLYAKYVIRWDRDRAYRVSYVGKCGSIQGGLD